MTQRPAEQWTPADTLGDRLRRLRRAVNQSQQTFAATIEVSPQALASYESGSREPRSVVAVAKRIELAFNVPATWVLGLDTIHPGPGPDGPPAAGGPAEPREDTDRYGVIARLVA